MRPSARLGVELHTESAVFRMFDALAGVIVQVNVSGLAIPAKGLEVDGKAVVLRRDLDTSRLEVLDRLIESAMTEFELEALASQCEGENLMA